MGAKGQNVVSLVYGLFFLLLGIFAEATSDPIQPISYVPGLAFVPIGVGIGLAVLERKYKLPALIGYFLASFLVLVYVFRAGTSILPFGLLLASFGLTRFGLTFYRED